MCVPLAALVIRFPFEHSAFLRYFVSRCWPELLAHPPSGYGLRRLEKKL
jgi:hypothetical protein